MIDLVLRLKNVIGVSIYSCKEALELFDNDYNKAYKYLEMTNNGVCYKRKDKKPFTKEDYINYISNKNKEKD